jgi:hypothetical protein
VRRRRGAAIVAVTLAAAALVLLLAGGGGSGAPPPAPAAATTTDSSSSSSSESSRTTSSSTTTTTVHRAAPPPALVVAPAASASASWAPVASVHGHPAAWIASRGGATLLRFDQRWVRLVLHAGSADGGVVGWRYGDQIERSEIHHVVAGFNGGFKLTYGNVGFVSGGHVAVALSPGLASIVTYTDGTTGVGSWDNGVPSRRSPVYSVLQNERLLVDRGVAAANVSSCIISCWGATIQNLESVARSALGIRADGQLVWAAGEQLTPAQLAAALIAGGAVRAVELDINPDWVAGYLYTHHPSGPVAVPVVPGQRGIAGQLLAPYARDFFTVVAR